MIIKKYNQFIFEDKLGDWLLPLYKDDEYVRNIVDRFIGEIPPDISLPNAVGLLSDWEKKEIEKLVNDYQANGIVEKEPVVKFSTETESLVEAVDLTPGGKGAFTSFLKVMTALGQKDVVPDFSICPKDFLLFYRSTHIETNTAKAVMARYSSLSRFVDDIDYTNNDILLYFGLKCDSSIEFGTMSENELTKFGNFKINASVIKWITTLDLKSAFSLKKELVNLTNTDISTLCSIKNDMLQYSPGQYDTTMPITLTDKILSFGYQNVGQWDNGSLDSGEFENIKSNFISWISTKKWSDKVLISVKPISQWLYIHIKLK